ncbi:MAG: PilN domain-containing protein [Phycisphaeraceae bacterium]
MSGPDLTPKPFLRRARKQAAIRRWVLPVSACALAAVVPIFLEMAKPADMSGLLAQERMVQAQSRIDTGQSQLNGKKAILAQHQRELQAEQHLTAKPDWSAVLKLVARQFDDKLLMTGFQLDDMKNNGVRSALGPLATDVPDRSVWLILNGVASANSDVSGLIMRLEALGLFERVVMTGTQRETFAGNARTSFTLACRVE